MKQLVNNKMVSVKRLLCLLAFLVLSLGIQAETCDSTSLALMEQTWKEFRELHPFSFQTIALKHYGQDTCVFVISEPPSWVSQNSIKELFNSYGGHMGIGRHTWGYDGVLMDAIGCVKLDETKFSSFENKLFGLICGSNYKPYYTNLDCPIPHTYCSPDTLQYIVSAEELYEIENAPIFVGYLPWEKKKPYAHSIKSWQTFQGLTSSCIYYSKEPGYVVWILNPMAISMADSLFKADARQFLLDTDLIIGAFPSINGVALIGRERQTPVDVLPPLRAETIKLLAQSVNDTLFVCIPSDSTECIDDTIYKTPVIMNDCLRHSELGNLMVLATELLMSYDTNNQVYDYFMAEYPYLNDAISESTRQGNTHSLFWYPNFDGCYHSLSLGESECLYPTFFEFDQEKEAESDSAYNFFISQKNVDLIRAKQYAFIYQAFKMQSRFTGISSVTLPDDRNTWGDAPSFVVTSSQFANISFIMQ